MIMLRKKGLEVLEVQTWEGINENDKIVYTMKDLMKIFNCGKNYAYSLVKIKGFPTIKIGKKIYIPKDNLQKWISENLNTEIEL